MATAITAIKETHVEDQRVISCQKLLVCEVIKYRNRNGPATQALTTEKTVAGSCKQQQM